MSSAKAFRIDGLHNSYTVRFGVPLFPFELSFKIVIKASKFEKHLCYDPTDTNMDSERAKTYEALNRFIQSQQALLDDLRSDIANLQNFRTSALATTPSPVSPTSPTALSCASSPPASPNNESMTEMHDDSDTSDGDHPLKEEFLSGLASRINRGDAPFEISDLSNARLELPQDIGSGLNWGLFSGSDTKPLHSLATTLSQAYATRNSPPAKQTSSPTITQQFIRAGRRSLLDPILKSSQTYIQQLSLALPSSDEEDEKLSPEELRRAREREKLRELKKRKIKGWGGLGLATSAAGQSGERRMRQGQLGVFIRRDVEDETGDVDVTMDADTERRPIALPQPPSTSHDYATPPTTPVGGKTVAHIQAAQRLAERKRIQPTKAATQKKKPKKVQLPKLEPDEDVDMISDPESTATPATTIVTTKSGKPKSETYKQAWTDEEQQLLEQLLEEIPDGEKNRWQKISRAMNGKRTPRQVASRVQKYFEKLKRFGVE